MGANTKIWDEIEAANRRYQGLRLSDAIDYDKFHLYSIVTHSTAREEIRNCERSRLKGNDFRLLF